MRRALLLAGALLSACLPETTMDEPGIAEIYGSGAPELASAVATADGWTIRFDRALLATVVVVGGPGDSSGVPGEHSCGIYSMNPHHYVLDLLAGGSQKLLYIAALGDCSVRVLLPLFGDVVRQGPGVSEADVDELRQAAPEGAALLLSGVAARGAEQKRFELALDRGTKMGPCRASAGAASTLVNVASREHQKFTMRFHPERLFFDRPQGALRFDAIAAADGAVPEGERQAPDGVVTTAELAAQRLDALPHEEGAYQATADGQSLWAWMLEQVLVGVVVVDSDGFCERAETMEKVGEAPPSGPF